MFGKIFKGIGAIGRKIRARRMAAGKKIIFSGIGQNRPETSADYAANRERFLQNELSKVRPETVQRPLNMPQSSIINTAGFSGTMQDLKTRFQNVDFKKWFPFLIVAALIVAMFKAAGKKKPVRRRRTTEKKSKSVTRTTGQRRIPATHSAGKPKMPKMYANGCKGKKGKQLGSCLQWWRKYRSGKCTK